MLILGARKLGGGTFLLASPHGFPYPIFNMWPELVPRDCLESGSVHPDHGGKVQSCYSCHGVEELKRPGWSGSLS